MTPNEGNSAEKTVHDTSCESRELPHLPEELHRLVAQYIHRDDLPNYRLASKQLCEIGSEELFGNVTFHYSSDSIERLRKIGGSDKLRKHVKTIFWDVNLWRIPGLLDEKDWRRYFSRKMSYVRRYRMSEMCFEAQIRGLNMLSRDQSECEAFLRRLNDEDRSREGTGHIKAFECFYNLRKIHVLHGNLARAHRGILKVDDCVRSGLGEPPVLRRGEGMNLNYSLTGREAFRSILMVPQPNLEKLKFDRVDFSSLHPLPSHSCENLRSLDLKITARTDHVVGQSLKMHIDTNWAYKMLGKGDLAAILSRLQRLECLRIDMDCSDEQDTWESRQPFSNISDVFGSEHIWPRLRKLSLCHFFATPDSLIALLGRHSSTLRDLRLRNIVFKDEEDNLTGEHGWPETLQHVAESLNLERATLSGQLGAYVPTKIGWDLDDDTELATAICEYLVNGGYCPLTANNAGPITH